MSVGGQNTMGGVEEGRPWLFVLSCFYHNLVRQPWAYLYLFFCEGALFILFL